MTPGACVRNGVRRPISHTPNHEKDRSRSLVTGRNLLTYLRAGEGIRTLDVDLGKVDDARFTPLLTVTQLSVSTT